MKNLKGLIVNVTVLDIKRGKRKDACDCPVARGIKRACKLPQSDQRTVSVASCILIGARYDAKTPARAVTFMRNFDAGKPVKPIQFVLR